MVLRPQIGSLLVLIPALGLLSGCSPPPDPIERGRVVTEGNAGGSGGSGTSAPGVGGAGGSGPSLSFDGGLNVSGTGGLPGNGTPETCDGVDNDANGIIDDVDAGGDGVCDCLSIATIGDIGPWSSGGNIFVTWLNERSPQGAEALGDEVLTRERLDEFQIIVTLHVGTMAVSNESQGTMSAAHHAFSAEEGAAFKGWVEAGGGAMTTIGYFSDEIAEVANVNLLLGTVGMGYSTTGADVSGFVQTWEPHPVSDGVSNIQAQNGVPPEGTGTVVATGQNGVRALEVIQAMNGRVVVWGDEWITYDSEWQDVDDQQIELFWLNILKWLSPPNECQVTIPPTVK